MKRTLNLVILMCGLAAIPVSAQMEAPSPAPDYQPLAPDQLDQLLGPIALYPDPLISQILPAATFPSQIVVADRYVTGGGDPNTVDQQGWDPSVQAMVHYPSVLQWMDNNLPWTTAVGDAFMNQQQDVMDSIQRLRRQAYSLGNLQSTPQQQVVDDGTNIEILPVDDSSVYLPEYQPSYVYYVTGYPVYFPVAVPLGPWLFCNFDWYNRNLVYWDRNHPRPPGWWRQPFARRPIARDVNVWHPANHPYAPATGGDRGWNNQSQVANRPQPGRTYTPTQPFRPAQPTPTPRPEPIPANRGSQGSPAEHYGVSRPDASTGAYIGIESSHDARTYSDRGAQSMRGVAPAAPAPAPRPAPTVNSGGGGGGMRGGGGGGGRR